MGARCKAQKYGPPELGKEDTISAMDRACRYIKDLQAPQYRTHHLTCDVISLKISAPCPEVQASQAGQGRHSLCHVQGLQAHQRTSGFIQVSAQSYPCSMTSLSISGLYRLEYYLHSLTEPEDSLQSAYGGHAQSIPTNVSLLVHICPQQGR